MDFENYDKDSNESDEDYCKFVEWLSNLAAADLRAAKLDPAAQKQALCCYYRRGENANLTPNELIDFLCISTPSILDDAGYTDAEATAIMEISDKLTNDEIDQTTL